MDRNTLVGLSLAGVRKRAGGGNCLRSTRSQRRAQEKAASKALANFERKTGLSASSNDGKAHVGYVLLQANLARISGQILVP